MNGFSDRVNLLGSSPGTAMHLLCGALGTILWNKITIKPRKDL